MVNSSLFLMGWYWCISKTINPPTAANVHFYPDAKTPSHLRTTGPSLSLYRIGKKQKAIHTNSLSQPVQRLSAGKTVTSPPAKPILTPKYLKPLTSSPTSITQKTHTSLHASLNTSTSACASRNTPRYTIRTQPYTHTTPSSPFYPYYHPQNPHLHTSSHTHTSSHLVNPKSIHQTYILHSHKPKLHMHFIPITTSTTPRLPLSSR